MAPTFLDVPPTSVHAPATDCLAARAIVLGTRPGEFNPAAVVTRAQAATFVARLLETGLGVTLPQAPPRYADVQEGVHAEAVNALSAAGVVQGVSPDRYEPARPVSRAQMATLLVRALSAAGRPLSVGPDAFRDDDGSVHEWAIDAGGAAGVLRGTSAGSFAPDVDIRRDQFASLLLGALNAGIAPDVHGLASRPPVGFAELLEQSSTVATSASTGDLFVVGEAGEPRVRVPTDVTRGIEVTGASGTLRLRPHGSSTQAVAAANGVAGYRGLYHSTTLAVQALDGSTLRQVYLIGASDAPGRFRTTVELPPGADLAPHEDGVVVRNENSELILALPPPWAYDDKGDDVPAHYEVEGADVILVVDHVGRDVAYPVVADPAFLAPLAPAAGGALLRYVGKKLVQGAVKKAVKEGVTWAGREITDNPCFSVDPLAPCTAYAPGAPAPNPAPPAPGSPRSTSEAITLTRGGAAPAGNWYSVALSGYEPGQSVTVTCRDSVDAQGFRSKTLVTDASGRADDPLLCYSGDGPDHWVTSPGVESNHVTWSAETSGPDPGSGQISLSQGEPAPAGFWYSAALSGFAPGSAVTVTCRDSVDPQGFHSQTFVIDAAGRAGDATLCYSADGPDHWVTGGGAESNHVSWGGSSTGPPQQGQPSITLTRGGAAQHGFWYSVVLWGFAPGSSVVVTCHDSVDPQGFYSQTLAIDAGGSASDSTLCFSGDGPDHWVTGRGVQSNHLQW